MIPGTPVESAEMRLTLEEQATLAMVTFLNGLILLFGAIGKAWDLFSLNLVILATIFLVPVLHSRMDHPSVQKVRDWYIPAFLLVIYLENRRLIPLVNPHDLDPWFIRFDRMLFLGHDPTLLLEAISHPVISEILQLSYASFYFLPLTLTLLVYLKKPALDFHVVMSTLLIGFYLTFLGYYLTPVIGPRFTLMHLQTSPLTGLFSFEFIRMVIDATEGVMRDCCPSGHALIALVSVLLSRRFYPRFFPLAAGWASLIIFSAVYLRYHYVTDILAGVLLAVPVSYLVAGLSEAYLKKSGSGTRS
jgi:membrane-associated phospholipid phosphatase